MRAVLEVLFVKPSVLIIKLGYSETCDPQLGAVVSLGDVFRASSLLHAFMDHHVTWLTAPPAAELLLGNHLIDSLVLAGTPEQARGLLDERFDVMVNLEKSPQWCEFSRRIDAGAKFGFRSYSDTGRMEFYPASQRVLSRALAERQRQPVQQILYEIISQTWAGQPYVLGYRPNVRCIYDIGFNHHVGPKWPTKRWPEGHWRRLERLLSDRYLISWQRSLNNIRRYIDWLASCRLIVTCDSLGLHLALALGRKVVALFGPTCAQEIELYGRGKRVVSPATCAPCYRSECAQRPTCMEQIDPAAVAEDVAGLLG